MKVLVVDYTALVSGGQRSGLELLRGLNAAGHDAALACPPGPLADLAAAQGVRVVAIPASQATFKLGLRRTPKALADMGRAARSLRRSVRREAPDVVHANSIRGGLVALAALPRRPPVVVHCRDVLPEHPVARVVAAIVLRRAAAVIAISRFVAERLAGPRWAERRVAVVDNPVDLARFDPGKVDREAARAALGVTDGLVLGVVGQITSWKRQDHAIRVLDALAERHPDAQLVIAGEAKFVSASTTLDNRAYERELHALAEGRPVRFLGEREDVERVLAALDVLLVPSAEEPFGRTIIEALAMDVPVVASDSGGPPEIVRDGVDGRLVPAADVRAWAGAVEDLLRRHGVSGSRDYAAERFATARHAEAVLAVYRSLTRSPPLPR